MEYEAPDMKMNKKEKKDLVKAEVVLIVIGAIGLGVVIWLAWLGPERAQSIDSYGKCVKAGNPIQESDPPVCVTKDGKRFIGPK